MRQEAGQLFMLTSANLALAVACRVYAKKGLVDGETAPKPFLGWFDKEFTAFDLADGVLLSAIILFILGVVRASRP